MKNNQLKITNERLSDYRSCLKEIVKAQNSKEKLRRSSIEFKVDRNAQSQQVSRRPSIEADTKENIENQTELNGKTSQMIIQSNKKGAIASCKTSIDDLTQVFSRNMVENE